MSTSPESTYEAAVTVEPLTIADTTFNSRLILGSGKYTDNVAMVQSLEASGTEMVTVALRRVNLSDPDGSAYIHHIDRDRYLFLPNTAGCYTAEDAIRTARLGRELGGWHWVKLEVIDE